MDIELIVDIIATIVGLISIGLLWNLNRRVGGKMSSALRWFIAGIVSMIIAFVWSAVFGHGLNVGMSETVHLMTTTAGETPVDIHHIFMTIGMVFFIFSAQRFSSLVKNE